MSVSAIVYASASASISASLVVSNYILSVPKTQHIVQFTLIFNYVPFTSISAHFIWFEEMISTLFVLMTLAGTTNALTCVNKMENVRINVDCAAIQSRSSSYINVCYVLRQIKESTQEVTLFLRTIYLFRYVWLSRD